MTKHLFLSCCCIAAMCLAGCGIKLNSNQCTIGNGRHTIHPSGTVVTEMRNVSDFSGIAASTGIKVTVEQSDSWKVVVEADENVIRFVDAKVIGSTLNIHYSDNVTIKGPTETHVKVWCPAVSSLSASSAAKISITGTMSGNSLQANASSGSSISGALNYDIVRVTASSAAEISLTGTISGSSLQANASSGGSISGALNYDVLRVAASSTAKIALTGTISGSSLQADASSGSSISGVVNYNNVTVTASSSARINFSGECVEYQAKVSSGAIAKTANLLSEKVYVKSSSSAEASVFASDYLLMDVSNGGLVIYYGRPYEIDQNVSSGGSIRRGK